MNPGKKLDVNRINRSDSQLWKGNDFDEFIWRGENVRFGYSVCGVVPLNNYVSAVGMSVMVRLVIHRALLRGSLMINVCPS